MEISGTLKGDLVKSTIVWNESNDGNTMKLDVDVTLERDEATALLGEEFAEDYFGSLRQVVESNEDGDETVYRFGYKTLDPPRWMVCQVHKADLWGTKLELQPEIRKIRAGEKAPVVTVALRFDVAVGDDAEMIGALGCKGGKTVKIKLAPKTPRLPLKERKAAPGLMALPLR